jgi:hypothetical protein
VLEDNGKGQRKDRDGNGGDRGDCAHDAASHR